MINHSHLAIIVINHAESPLSSPNEFKGFSWVRSYSDDTSGNPLYMPAPPSPVQPKRDDHAAMCVRVGVGVGVCMYVGMCACVCM